MAFDNYIDLKQRKLKEAEDFIFLRNKAIQLLEQENETTLNWTDYNIHDPGITIIEQLCFAITDLAYRTGFDIKDILTKESGLCDLKANSFYEAADILSTHPYTVIDFAKLLIDRFEEIGNAWIYPLKKVYPFSVAKDIYCVVVRPDLRILRKNEKRKADFNRELELEVYNYLLENRNINQFFPHVTILKEKNISLEVELSIEKNQNVEKLLADIFYFLASFLNPRPQFDSADLLQAKEIPQEDIFNGPKLANGILLNSSLKEQKKLFSIEEISKKLSAFDGVLRIRNMHFIYEGQAIDRIILANDEFLTLKRTEKEFYDISGFKVFINDFKVSVSEEIFNLYCKENEQKALRQFKNEDDIERESKNIGGIYRNLGTYFSIQNFFPRAYQIGEDGVLQGAPSNEKAAVKQLKAYLLVFEQILANYLTQLSYTDRLFDPFISKNPVGTYFYQPLYNVPDIQTILKSYQDTVTEKNINSWEDFKKDNKNGYIQFLSGRKESGVTFYDRKNAFLHHTLARFNINADSYPVALFYATYSDKDLIDQLWNQLEWKSALVKNIQIITRDRFRAINVSNQKIQKPKYHFLQLLYDLLFIKQIPMQRITERIMNMKHLKMNSANKQNDISEEKNEATISNDEWKLFLDEEAYKKIENDFKEEDASLEPQNKLIFKNKNTDFISRAINVGFYKITKSVSNNQFALVVYNDGAKWEIAGKFITKRSAYKAIMKSVQQFRKISIESEGFYMIEHVLLRPPLEAPYYGYILQDKSGRILFESKHWQTHKERSEELSKKISDEIPELKKNTLPNAVENDKEIFKTKYIVKCSDGSKFDEDLLSNTITIVFPEWPARFKDPQFMSYMKRLIAAELPAHVKVNFLIYDFYQMQKFEELYFKWIDVWDSPTFFDSIEYAYMINIIKQANVLAK